MFLGGFRRPLEDNEIVNGMYREHADHFFCGICKNKYTSITSVKKHIRDDHKREIESRLNPLASVIHAGALDLGENFDGKKSSAN